MKKCILFFVVLITGVIVNAQGLNRLQINDKTGLVTFSQIVEIPEKGKSELYSYALEWVATKYVSAQNVIQMSDPDGGTIVLKAIADVHSKPLMGVSAIFYFKYKLVISIKDGKARVIIDNLINEEVGSSNSNKRETFGNWGRPEEWKLGKANGYKQKQAKLDEIADNLANHMDALLNSFAIKMKEKASDNEW